MCVITPCSSQNILLHLRKQSFMKSMLGDSEGKRLCLGDVRKVGWGLEVPDSEAAKASLQSWL